MFIVFVCEHKFKHPCLALDAKADADILPDRHLGLHGHADHRGKDDLAYLSLYLSLSIYIYTHIYMIHIMYIRCVYIYIYICI